MEILFTCWFFTALIANLKRIVTFAFMLLTFPFLPFLSLYNAWLVGRKGLVISTVVIWTLAIIIFTFTVSYHP